MIPPSLTPAAPPVGVLFVRTVLDPMFAGAFAYGTGLLPYGLSL